MVDIPLNLGMGICKKDNKAFIFYLNDLRAYNIKENLDAIYCSPQYGPFFCGKNNFTFKLFNNCEINGGQCCKADESHYDGYLHDYEINNGKRDFKVCELEVFKVNVG